MTVQPAISIGIRVELYGSSTCEASTFISPAQNLYPNDCNTFADKAAGKAIDIKGFLADSAGDFTCADNQYIVLQVWQSDENCNNLPEATFGPLQNEVFDGGCNIMRARSAKLACQDHS
jgi:hypothetical protein